MLPPNILSSA